MKQGHNKKYKENVVDSISEIMTKAKDHYSGVQTQRQSLMKEINTFNNSQYIKVGHLGPPKKLSVKFSKSNQIQRNFMLIEAKLA